MSTSSTKGVGVPHQCPVCGTTLAAESPLPAYDAPCTVCTYMVWCRKTTVDGVIVLHVLPGRTPDHVDIECLVEALVRSEGAPRVVVDLSDLDVVSSSLIARLVALNKRVRAAKGRLILCGLHPFVREAFFDSSLNRVFEILDDEEAALASLSRPHPG